MSEEKQTFTDPETGEEIESTGLAQIVARLAFGLLGGLIGGLAFGVFGKLIGGPAAAFPFGLFGALIVGTAAATSIDGDLPLVGREDARRQLIGLLGVGLVGGLTFSALTGPPLGGVLFGLFLGLVGGLIVGLPETIRQSVSRQQHFLQQRRLKRKLLEEEWVGVPARALSRARQPGSPRPTDTSLTPAGKPEEGKPHLTEGMNKETKTEIGLLLNSPPGGGSAY